MAIEEISQEGQTLAVAEEPKRGPLPMSGPGFATSAAAVNNVEGAVDDITVYVRGADGCYWRNEQRTLGWLGWKSIQPGMQFTTGPAVASSPPDYAPPFPFSVAGIGLDRQFYLSQDGGPFAPFSRNVAFTSRPAIAFGGGGLYAVARSTDNALWWSRIVYDQYSDWVAIPNSSGVGAPGIANDQHGNVVVAHVGMESQGYMYTKPPNGDFSAPINLGPTPLTSAPSLCNVPDPQGGQGAVITYAFARDTNWSWLAAQIAGRVTAPWWANPFHGLTGKRFFQDPTVALADAATLVFYPAWVDGVSSAVNVG